MNKDNKDFKIKTGEFRPTILETLKGNEIINNEPRIRLNPIILEFLENNQYNEYLNNCNFEIRIIDYPNLINKFYSI